MSEHNLVELTRKVADEQPDFVYEPETSEFGGTKCVYVRDGKPSCLIGHSALEGGFIGIDFEMNRANDLGVDELLRRIGIYDEFDCADLAWLEGAQEAQDTGQTWGEAIKFADAARADYIEDYGDDGDD